MSLVAALDTNLTERQLLIWLEQLIAPRLAANNMVAAFAMRPQPALDLARFRRAFASVVAASDALRTVFLPTDAGVRQRVRTDLAGELEVVDLTTATDPDAAYAHWFDRRRQAPLDLGTCAFDGALVLRAGGEVVWYLCVHHIVCDASSLALVYRRTLAAYLGDPPEPAAPFAAYVAHLAAQARTPAHAAAVAFWRGRLAERLDPVRFYGVAPGQQKSYSRRRQFTLDAVAAARLRPLEVVPGVALGGDLGRAAVFLTVLAAFVHQATGNRRVGIGMPVQNRPGRDFRGTIGLLMEVVAVRTDVDAADTVAALLARVRADLFEGLRHSRCCVANPSHGRAFEVMLDYQGTAFPARLGPTRVELSTGTAGLGSQAMVRTEGQESVGALLIVTVHDRAACGRPTVTLDCDGGVFDEARADRAAAHFERLLGAALAAPAAPLAGVDAAGGERSGAAAQRPTDPDAGAGAPTAGGDRPFDPPRPGLETDLAAMWRDLLGAPRIGRDDDFFALGGDSVQALRLLHRLRARFATPIALGTLFTRSSLTDMAAALVGRGAPVSGLFPLQPLGARPPLFLLCGGPIYQSLAQRLGEGQPIHGVFLPDEERLFGGRDRYDPTVDRSAVLTVEALAGGYLDVIRATQAHGPYFLGGLSTGGLLAFEVAQRLRALGEEVALVVLLDAWLPRARRRRLLPWALGHLRRALSGDTAALRRVGRRLPWWPFRVEASAPPAAVGAGSPLIDLGEARRVARRYDRSIRPYQGRVLLLRAQDRTEVAGARLVGEYGWEHLVRGLLEVVDVRGGHTSMLNPPFVDAVADHLRQRIDAVAAELGLNDGVAGVRPRPLHVGSPANARNDALR